MKKRLLSLLLLSALLLSSCGGTAGAGTTETTENIPETTAEPEPVYDLEGFTLNIGKISQDQIVWVLTTVGVEEENGDVLNDAFARRNQIVTEKYNFNIVETELGGTGDVNNMLTKIVNAGEDTYQTFFTRIDQYGGPIMNGMLTDVTTVGTIDLSKPCWNQNLIDSLSVKEHVYILDGDITAAAEDCVEVLVYNTSYANALKLDNLYDAVRKGTWTIDKMYACTKAATSDVNGDTKIDYDDAVGVVANNDGLTAMLVSCGAQAITKKGDDVLVTADTDLYARAFAKVAQIYASDVYLPYGPMQAGDHVSHLETNHLLFDNCVTSFARRFLRECKTDFGFLPTPKLDEKQENYISVVCNSTCGFVIPKSCADLDNTGLALQLLCQNSSEITSAYYDICLQSKYTRDEESWEMLAISIENIVYDVGYIFNTQFSGLHTKLLSALTEGGDTLASTVASLRDAAEAGIEKFYNPAEE